MMCCLGPAWAVLGYYLGRWLLFAWRPLEYRDSPRWMCNAQNDGRRRVLLAFLAVLLTLWYIPLVYVLAYVVRQDPGFAGCCLSITLVLCGLVRWMDPPKSDRPGRPSGWMPVTGRRTGGLLIAVGLLGLVWQFLVPHH